MAIVIVPAAVPGTGPLAIDLGGILPERLAGLDAPAVARLPIRADGQPCRLGDLFVVEGSADDGRIEFRGDFSRVHRIGAEMAAGRIEVGGDAGRHAGERMSGGTLAIAGGAGDWLAAELAGGSVTVAGPAGDNVAAALPGSDIGMRGGMVIVGGSVGGLAGARMRRGILAVAGACGPAAAFEMRAGSVVCGAGVGSAPALGMRRGSLVVLDGACPIPAGFRPGATWAPTILPLLLRRLAAAGFRPGARGLPDAWEHWHGDALSGGRGEIFRRPAAGDA
jgi:formylmethanofuran dehydrogenase subunit C